MSKLMKQTDGTWSATRRVANNNVRIYVRDIGHGYFGCTAVHGSFGTELADTIGETRKVAIDRAIETARRKLSIPSQCGYLAAIGPCGK